MSKDSSAEGIEPWDGDLVYCCFLSIRRKLYGWRCVMQLDTSRTSHLDLTTSVLRLTLKYVPLTTHNLYRWLYSRLTESCSAVIICHSGQFCISELLPTLFSSKQKKTHPSAPLSISSLFFSITALRIIAARERPSMKWCLSSQ